ncbi:MAG: tyrosine-protein phosphatase [Leadbetterella sp.]|nr:tyrosine-protein phosphatase [Leadbetterella sp.]
MSKHFLYIFTFLGLGVAASAQEVTLKSPVGAEHRSGAVKLTFDKDDVYRVFSGTSKENIDWQTATFIVKGTELQWRTEQFRPYFGVITSANDTLIVTERKIPFARPQNFRDLGGLVNMEGKTVKWGQFYRSDELSGLRNEEFAGFQALGIKAVYDLRSEKEITEAPNRLPEDVQYNHRPVFNESGNHSFEGIEDKIKSGTITEAETREMMKAVNKAFATENIPVFRKVLTEVLESGSPVLYHCTAGKDRTGFLSAMILSVLKVDRNTILDEYEMTNYYTKQKTEALLKSGHPMMANVKPEVLKALMGVDRSYIQEAFRVIDGQFGGIDAYLKNEMGITDSRRAAYIAKFTY